MEYFNENDFKLLNETYRKLGNKNEDNYKLLYITEEKTEYWASGLQKNLFIDGNVVIRKRPTNQKNFYKGYTWAQIFPNKTNKKELVYTVGINDEYFILKIDILRTKSSKKLEEEYEKIRGDFYNSKIVEKLSIKDGLNMNFDQLIDWSVQIIKDSLESKYNEMFLVLKPYFSNKDTSNIIENEEFEDNSELSNKIIEDSNILLNNKKQIILYGPAGTGKTFNTKKIIEEHSGESYEELKNAGRIKFVTFHQSFAYEDFIEGIKPKLDKENVSYEISDGIFKKINNLAKNDLNEDTELNREQCYDKLLDELKIIKTLKLYTPIDKKEFSISINLKNNLDLVFGDGKSNSLNKDIIISKSYEKSGSLKSYYRGVIKYILDNYNKSYYLIIDEINRGNISKIFGELITLLEVNKRLGEDNELTTTLPYSKEEFGIPPNLYIIGTMNTSDKSIAHLDIALRRRFGFIEMLPDYGVIKNEKARSLLELLNERIEILLDKDHLIGHSFFCDIPENNEDSDFDEVEKISYIMQYEIVPLLEEYFYSDYEKIQLVLGNKNLQAKKYSDKHENSFKKILENSNKEYKYEYWFESKTDNKEFDIELKDNDNKKETKQESDQLSEDVNSQEM